jgi:hypothetical protein
VKHILGVDRECSLGVGRCSPVVPFNEQLSSIGAGITQTPVHRIRDPPGNLLVEVRGATSSDHCCGRKLERQSHEIYVFGV